MGRHGRALAALERALALNPNSADALAAHAIALGFVGRPEEALEEQELAVRLNPHHPDWYLIGIGRNLYLLGRYQESIPYLERLVDAGSELVSGRLYLAANRMALGRAEEAGREVAALLAQKPDFTLAEVPPLAPFKQARDLDQLLSLLRAAGLPE